MKSWLRILRHRLAHVDAVPQLALLGIISGLLSGGLVILFRLTIELPQTLFMPDRAIDHFEALPLWLRFALPLIGSVILAIGIQLTKPESRQVGVAHVINRFINHQGWLNTRNAFVQFWSGAVAALTGQSVGREGPAVHLGAASSSIMARWLKLPNNSIRILVGCGVAASISASFNTPFAGVVFAMEVVMMEYSISTFTPIILASVSGAVLSRAVFSHDPAFTVPPLQLGSLYEIPYIVLLGLLIGVLAAAFIYISEWLFNKTKQYAIGARIITAGFAMSCLGLVLPQVLGIGYDTVESALMGNIPLLLLVAVVVGKLLATAICVGLGSPGGVIGPTLVIGACAGGVLGTLGQQIFPQYAASAGFYTMLGMAGMMSAALQAPLSALIALLELTANPNIILPGMLVVVIANLVCSEIFKQRSIFIALLRAQGLNYGFDRISHALYKVGVQAAMDRSFIRHGNEISYHDAGVLMENSPRWLLVDKENDPVALMPMADIARYLKAQYELPVDERPDENDTFNLLAIPSNRKDLAEIHLHSSLKEALDCLNEKNVDAVYITRMTAPMIHRIYGILTRKDIARYYTK